MHLHRKIDELGKGQILGGTAESIERLAKEFRSKQLYFRTKLPKSELEALLVRLERVRK